MSQAIAVNKGGRPTVYKPAILRKAKHYLANYEEYDDEIPSIAGLADTLGVARDSLYEWAKHDDKKEFSDTIKAIRVKQERVLLNNGLNGTFNSKIAGIVLLNHGYSDKPTEQAGSKITVNVNRGNITIESGSDKLTIKDIEHG